MESLKKRLLDFSDIFESIKGLTIIRKGLTAASPIIIIGAMALMLTNLPVPAYQNFLQTAFNGRLLSILHLIYNSSFGMLSLFMVISISHKYASSFSGGSDETLIVSLIALVSYFTLNGSAINGTAAEIYDSTQFFSAIVCAILTCIMYKKITKHQKEYESFSIGGSDFGFGVALRSIFPATMIIITFALANYIISRVFDVNSLQGLFGKIADFVFQNAGNGYLAFFLFTLLAQVMWIFGIHGNNVLEPIVQERFIDVGENIFSKSFQDTFVNMGGSGTCICILIGLLLVSRTKKVRHITKLGMFPAVFNISEIITLGIPILFNPIFFIPFLATPLILGTIGYFACAAGLVPIVNTQVAWTTPILLSGYYATGSIAGTVLQVVNIIVGTLCYIPFIKMYEEKLHEEEVKSVKNLVSTLNECEKAQKEPEFLKRNDAIGQTAKALAVELEQAIKDDQIIFYFQPQINSNGKCIGCEALVRWNHPTVGFIYPPLIIEIAKEANLLKHIEKLLIDRSCALIKSLQGVCKDDFKVSINITIASILRNDLESMIGNALKHYGIKPHSLWIELTENEAFTSAANVVRVLDQLQLNGHKLLIDDFGMGHTSLKYLQTNKFDVVKLDGSLTRDILSNEVSQKIINSIVELGNTLKFDIIAEFVETTEQKEKLSELGCTIFQGYLYSPPLEEQAFIEYYTKHKPS